MFAVVDVVADPEVIAQAQSLLKTLVLGLLGAIGTLTTIGITYLSKRIVAWAQAKAEKAKADAKSAEIVAGYEALKCMTQMLDSLSTTAVAEVEQTLVRQLKAEDGEWNSDTALRARDTAFEIMKRHAGENGMAKLQECSGQTVTVIEGMFRSWIEKKVGESGDKKSGSPIVPMNEAA